MNRFPDQRRSLVFLVAQKYNPPNKVYCRKCTEPYVQYEGFNQIDHTLYLTGNIDHSVKVTSEYGDCKIVKKQSNNNSMQTLRV